MDRRNFIKLGGTSVAVIPLLSFPVISCSSNAKESIYPLLQDYMPSDTIKLIGKEYLQKNELKDPEFYSGLSKNEAAERVKKDFEEDRVVIVSGWVLSETEARQCAAIQIQKK
jgi:hypothetical protein